MRSRFESECGGCGLVRFFALINLKNGLRMQIVFPDPSAYRTNLGLQFDGFSEFY